MFAGLGSSASAGLWLEGFSLAPLIHEPFLHERSPAAWRTAAFSQYPRCMNSTDVAEPPYLVTRDACIGHPANEITVRCGGHLSLRLRQDTRVPHQPPAQCSRGSVWLQHMGYSMRTAEWRYAEWPRWICNGSGDDDNACSDLSKAGSESRPGAAYTDVYTEQTFAHSQQMIS